MHKVAGKRELRKGGFRIGPVVASCLIAAAFTYLSLAVPGRVSAVCSNVDTPVYCPVLAYGFPLPFLADSQGVSPLGSVARDPLSLLIGLDDILWPRLGLSFLFWMLLVLGGRFAWRRWKRVRHGV
ncbi:hypothetical protein [Massilia sp. ST3]|uniref:hypothetical protein n=1 Tax=Massilia sp. ST3 TaxID=2824903 RepID=UPI001B819C7D|nr:hypothetical protein [Massilia sp. ST3]MBQ5948576.1 hypothetical protein [Massilia sp. ST3]